MSTSIEKLELEIQSNSGSAVNGIDALAKSLERLKLATKGGLGLSSISKNLKGISDALSTINSSSISNIKEIGNAFKTLSGVKVSSSIGNQITAIGKAINSFDVGNFAPKIREIVSALQPLSTIGKSGFSSVVSGLKSLPKAFEGLQAIDMQQFGAKIREVTQALRPLATEMQKVANGFASFPTKIQNVIKSNSKLVTSNDKVSKSYVNMWAKLRMAYNVIRTGASIIGSLFEKSNDYVENINLFNVSMGEYAEEARKYAETVGDVMGIDPGEWMRNQGMFMTLATGFGVTSDRANTMGKNLTQLGYDISSFFNIPYEDAMAKLQSGLAGELEPLRRIGYDLSQARLQQEAYTLGITKKVSAMTQAEKAELRYHAILTQVTTAQGDMGRTLESPANMLRILKSEVNQAARAIGNLFIPILQAVLPYLTAFFKIIRLVANSIASLFGFKLPEIDTSGIGGLAGGAEDASDALGDAADNAKKLQKYTMGFDELNVIDPDKGSKSGSGGGGGGAGGFDFELPEYEFMPEGMESKVNDIVKKFQELVPTTDELNEGIKKITEITGLDTLWDGFKTAVDNSKTSVSTLFETISTSFQGKSAELETMAGNIGKALTTTTKTFSKVVSDMIVIASDEFKKYVDENSPKIKETGDNVLADTIVTTDAFTGTWQSAIDTFKEWWDTRGAETFRNISKALGDAWTLIMDIYNNIISPVIQNVAGDITWLWDNHLKALWGNLLTFFSSIGDFISALWSEVLQPFLSNFTELFGPNLVSAISYVGDVFGTIIGMISDLIGGLMTSLGGLLDFLTGIFTGDWKKAWEGIKNVFEGIWNAIWGIIKGVINLIIDGINKFIRNAFNALRTFVNSLGTVVEKIGDVVGKNWGWKWEGNAPQIPKLAEGGFPDTGQLFIAREAGAEMVGNIGRRTAVANNDQIVAGIASGVASANAESNALLKEQNSLLKALLEKESGVYLDGKRLTNSVEKYQSQRGRQIVVGGAY